MPLKEVIDSGEVKMKTGKTFLSYLWERLIIVAYVFLVLWMTVLAPTGLIVAGTFAGVFIYQHKPALLPLCAAIFCFVCTLIMVFQHLYCNYKGKEGESFVDIATDIMDF